MEFFSGFQWAVPKAFSDAVALCRFEEGDILYDTKKAYDDNWEKASNQIEYSLQVKYPARAKGGVSENGDGLFSSNWNSNTRIDLYKNLKKVGVEQIHTTQGRLYTALWKGDLSVLEKESEEPSIPLIIQDVTRILEQATQKAKEFSVGFPVFIMARDLSNPVSREKFSKILTALKKHLYDVPEILTPKQGGLIEFANIAPTVEIAFFPVNEINDEELHGLVKKAVYIPSKDAKKDKFRVSAHGIIV